MGLTPEQWRVIDSLLERMGQTGQDYIRGGNEHSGQVFTVNWSEDGILQIHTIAIVPMVQDQKDAAAAAIGALVAPFDGYIFLTEGWRLIFKSREEVDEHLESGRSASQHPDRVEVFALHFVSKLGDQVRWEWDIDRPEDGPPTLINRTITRNPAEGRFANFYEYSMPADGGKPQ